MSVPAVLSESAARQLTDRIRTGAEQVWTLLQSAHKGKAWLPLGYTSWEAYTSTEFGYSRSYAYRLLEQGNVVNRLTEAAALSPDGDTPIITEAAARDIAPDVDLIANTVTEAVGEDDTPDDRREKVRQIVEDYRTKQAERRHKPPEPHPARDLTRACETIAAYGEVNAGSLQMDWGLVAKAADTLSGFLAQRQHALTGA